MHLESPCCSFQLNRYTLFVSDFAKKFKSLCDHLIVTGYHVDNMDKTHWFLCGLGLAYKTFTTAPWAIYPHSSSQTFSLEPRTMNIFWFLYMLLFQPQHPSMLNTSLFVVEDLDLETMAEVVPSLVVEDMVGVLFNNNLPPILMLILLELSNQTVASLLSRRIGTLTLGLCVTPMFLARNF